MNIRKIVFTLLDNFRGRPMGKQLKDIERKMLDTTEQNPTQDNIDKFITHATSTTKFYQKYQGKALKEFPIINKTLLKENYNDFLSDKYSNDELIPVTTSGSTGAPFTYLLTQEKKFRRQAEVIYFGRIANYELGIKHAYTRMMQKSIIKSFMQNQILMNPTNMNQKWLKKQRKKLKKRCKIIIGYPSTISSLAKYCIEQGDTPKDFFVKGVITSAEILQKDQKEAIEKAFGCSVFNRYSTEEFGVLANSCEAGNLHINNATFYIELLKENKDAPVRPGEVGRIVVTDLYSHAFPLIRYDVGDMGIMDSECSCGHKGYVFKSIQGRKIEKLYDIEGQTVSPFAINSAMRDIPGVLQFQFIQEKINVYRLLIVPHKKLESSVESIIKKRFTSILGKDANIIIEKLEDIPPLKSGKRPYIRQNYKKENI